MNYEKIILELLTRIQCLEEDVLLLKSRNFILIDDREEDVSKDEAADKKLPTRTMAKNRVIQEIENNLPDYTAMPANRSNGGGLMLLLKEGTKYSENIKFYHSKTHVRGGNIEFGWYTVRLNELQMVKLCIFSLVDELDNWNFFIFEQEDLLKYSDEHRDCIRDLSDETLHLYFRVKDGKATEIREKVIDVTAHLNNWDILKSVM